MPPGFGALEFDLPGALLVALIKKFDEIEPAELTDANAALIPEEQGVYALYLKDPRRLVYIGKTDSDAGLRHRLRRHARKLVGRRNLAPLTLSSAQYAYSYLRRWISRQR